MHLYDHDGEPISLELYCDLLMDVDYCILWQDVIAGHKVSTVWLGLDHGRGGRRQLFETMVFRGADDYGELDCRRYATKEEARLGHIAMCDETRKQYERGLDELFDMLAPRKSTDRETEDKEPTQRKVPTETES